MYGYVVRQARRSRDMTQTELAEITGIKQSNISAIEAGRRQPSAATLHQLLLGCGYELVAVAGQRVIPVPASEDDLSGDVPTVPPPAASDEERARQLRALLGLAEAAVRADR